MPHVSESFCSTWIAASLISTPMPSPAITAILKRRGDDWFCEDIILQVRPLGGHLAKQMCCEVGRYHMCVGYSTTYRRFIAGGGDRIHYSFYYILMNIGHHSTLLSASDGIVYSSLIPTIFTRLMIPRMLKSHCNVKLGAVCPRRLVVNMRSSFGGYSIHNENALNLFIQLNNYGMLRTPGRRSYLYHVTCASYRASKTLAKRMNQGPRGTHQYQRLASKASHLPGISYTAN